MKKEKYIVVAIDEKNGIGLDNKLPWKFKKEMQYFKERTIKVHDSEKENAVIMGRKTWESIPEKNRPLKNRINIILTSKKDYKADGAIVCGSLEEAMTAAEDDDYIEKIYFIGGAEVFSQALEYCDGLYVTHVREDYHCDKFFPEISECFGEAKKLGSDEENGVKFDYMLYKCEDE